MRDIRADLKERIAKIETERREIANRLEVLSRQEQAAIALIEQENAMWPEPQRNLFEQPLDNGTGKERTELGSLLVRSLAGGNPMSLTALKQMAETNGYDFEGKQPGRVIHFALLGMTQTGQVEMVDKGVWRLKDATAQRTPDSRKPSNGTKFDDPKNGGCPPTRRPFSFSRKCLRQRQLSPI